MKNLIFVLSLIASNTLYAVDYTTIKAGDWSDPTVWDCNCVPDISDYNASGTFTINHAVTRTSDLSIKGGGVKTLIINESLDITGNVTVGNNTDQTITINAPFTVSETFTITGGPHTININDDLTVNTLDISTGGHELNGLATLYATDLNSNENSSSTINVDVIVSGTISSNGPYSPVFNGDVITGYLDLQSNYKSIFNGDVSVLNDLSVGGSSSGGAVFNGNATIGGDIDISGSGRLDGTGSISWGGDISITGSGEFGGGSATGGTGDQTYTAYQKSGGKLRDIDGNEIDPADIPNPIDLSTGSNFVDPAPPSALPVDLVNFEANPKDDLIELTWQTSSETNNSHFEIQRSTDLVSWSIIGQKEGNLNSHVLINYLHYDSEPNHGINYYRLKQIDLDGQFAYSNIIFVDFNQTKNWIEAVYPNPSKGSFTIEISSGFNANQVANLHLVNLYGEEISFDAEHHDNKIIVNTTGVRAGVYFIDLRFSNFPLHKIVITP